MYYYTVENFEGPVDDRVYFTALAAIEERKIYNASLPSECAWKYSAVVIEHEEIETKAEQFEEGRDGMRTVKSVLKKYSKILSKEYPDLEDEIVYTCANSDFVTMCVLWVKSIKKTKIRSYGEIDYEDLIKNAILEYADLLHDASDRLREEIDAMKGGNRNDS